MIGLRLLAGLEGLTGGHMVLSTVTMCRRLELFHPAGVIPRGTVLVATGALRSIAIVPLTNITVACTVKALRLIGAGIADMAEPPAFIARGPLHSVDTYQALDSTDVHHSGTSGGKHQPDNILTLYLATSYCRLERMTSSAVSNQRPWMRNLRRV